MFALNATAARRAVLSGTVLQGLMVTVPVGVPLFLVLMLATGETHLLGAFSLEAIAWFSAAGMVHFVIGRYCNFSASAAIGTNLASPILQAEVLVTLLLAMAVLGETLTPLRTLGIVLLFIGPGLVTTRDRTGNQASSASKAQPVAPKSDGRPAFVPRYKEGFTYATLAAIAYGFSPIFIGLGLKAAGGSGAMAGGLVSYIAATALVGIVLVVTRQPPSTYRIAPSAMRWFLFAGLIAFLSQAFRYAAMALAPVSVVTALQRLSSLFRIYLGWLINRDYEVFDSSVITATVVSMVGAMALSISTDLFLSLADWPDWLVHLARLQWP
jgi:drug/metabolite transporter (DMT)-like permease